MNSSRVMDLQKELLSLRISDWYDKLFSWQMAFMVIMLVLPWVIWWKIADRRRLVEIFSFGLLISVISSFFNGNGLNLLLWSYPYRLLPFSPRAYTFSLSVIPVSFMILYQYFPKWKSFTFSTTLLAAITAFILQPIFSLVGFYRLINWNYFNSFLALLSIGLMSRLVHQTVVQRAHNTVPDTSKESLSHSDSPAPAYKIMREDRDDD